MSIFCSPKHYRLSSMNNLIAETYYRLLYFNQSCLILWQETQRLVADPVPGIHAMPDENNARHFHVVVAGPVKVNLLCTIPVKFWLARLQIYTALVISIESICSRWFLLLFFSFLFCFIHCCAVACFDSHQKCAFCVMISVRLAGQLVGWESVCGKHFNVAIFLEAIIKINVKLCMVVVLIELYSFMPLSLTLIVF